MNFLPSASLHREDPLSFRRRKQGRAKQVWFIWVTKPQRHASHWEWDKPTIRREPDQSFRQLKPIHPVVDSAVCDQYRRGCRKVVYRRSFTPVGSVWVLFWLSWAVFCTNPAPGTYLGHWARSGHRRLAGEILHERKRYRLQQNAVHWLAPAVIVLKVPLSSVWWHWTMNEHCGNRHI